MTKDMSCYYRYFESGHIHTVEQIPITKEHRKRIKHRRIMRAINKERMVLNLSWLFQWANYKNGFGFLSSMQEMVVQFIRNVLDAVMLRHGFIMVILFVKAISIRELIWMSRGSQCIWICIHCGQRCGGVTEHEGPHQCPKHYKLICIEKGIYGCIVCYTKYPNYPLNWCNIHWMKYLFGWSHVLDMHGLMHGLELMLYIQKYTGINIS